MSFACSVISGRTTIQEEARAGMPVPAACHAFMADAEAQRLSIASLKKYRLPLINRSKPEKRERYSPSLTESCAETGVQIGAGYFASLSVPAVEGREFDDRDQRFEPGKSKARPVVLNETAVRSFFGTRDPIGRRILDKSVSYEVVGVVKDLSAPESENAAGVAVSALPVIYLPLTRTDFADPPPGGMVVMVRARRGTDAMTGVRRELGAIDPNLAMFNVRTLAEEVDQTTVLVRIHTIIYGAIGAFGLVLASIGLAGVTAYSVARLRREIGIRMALGARNGQVLRLVLREGGGLVIGGTVFGFAGAFGVSRLLSRGRGLSPEHLVVSEICGERDTIG